MFIENNDYEILTPSGWQDFKGITQTEKIVFSLILDNGNQVSATAGHYFFCQGVKTKVSDLSIGYDIDTLTGSAKIVSIIEKDTTLVYDLIEVADKNHQFLVNGDLITKNCDEFAFVRPTIAKAFWTSISPTLATGGKAMITSTPNSDEDQFALIWKEAIKCIDDFGNVTKIGKNGFKSFKSVWSDHPDRDDKWAAEEISRIGIERFRREMNCCNGNTIISLEKNSEIFNTTIGDFFKNIDN